MRTFYGFHNQKIKGVTFHHRSLKRHFSLKSKYKLEDFFEINNLFLEIQRESPPPLTHKDIRHFLCDQGRNEIHTHVSICVDFISKWSGILKIMERYFSQNIANQGAIESFLSFANENKTVCNNSELEVFLSTKRVLSLWQHRLRIFEMMTEAQGSLRNLPSYTISRLKTDR